MEEQTAHEARVAERAKDEADRRAKEEVRVL